MPVAEDAMTDDARTAGSTGESQSPASNPLIPVCALVVTGNSTAALEQLLERIQSGVVTPDEIVVLDRTQTHGDGLRNLPSGVRVERVGAVSVREAVRLAASQRPTRTLLWVLPVGSEPDTQALKYLVEAYFRAAREGMVGPKLLDAQRPDLLRSAGFRVTRTGRLIDDPGDLTPDQGQVNDREDVVAVPLAGALIDSALVSDLHGWNPRLRDIGADLDFGWRAQRAWRRVVLAPRARVRVTSGLGRASAVDAPSQRSARRVALARCSWWALPWYAVWLLVSALASAIALLIVKRPRAAAHALSELGALEPLAVLRARAGSKGPARVGRSDFANLFVSGAQVRARVFDHVHDALFPARTRDDAPVEQRRSGASRILTHPGFLALLAAVATVVAAGRTLGTQTLTQLGHGLVGGELLGGSVSAEALWSGWADSWSGGGLGAPVAVGAPHVALLAMVTMVVEHLPGGASLVSSGGFVASALLLGSVPMAVGTAYVAARVLTPSRWPRAIGALLWGLLGPALPIVAQGRLGPAVALLLLPLVGAGLVLLARRDGTATAAWATALATGILGAFVPSLLVGVMAVSLVLVVVGVDGAARLRALVPVLVSPLLLGLWWLEVAKHPALLLAGPGATSWADTPPPWWQQALLHPGGPGSTPALLTLAVAALALVGLVRGRGVRSVATGAAILLVAGIAAAVLSDRVVLVRDPAGLADPSFVVTPWPGVGMLVAQLALVTLAVLAMAPAAPTAGPASATSAAGTAQAAAAPSGRWATRTRLAGLLLGAVITVAVMAAGVRAGLGTQLQAWQDPRPAVAVEHTNGGVAGRTLFLRPEPGRLTFDLQSREVGALARSLPQDRRFDAALAPVVAGLADGTIASSAPLADLAIGAIALPQNSDADVRRSLDSAEGLTRLVARGGYDFWRVSAVGDPTTRPVAPPRLQLRVGDAVTEVTTTGMQGATQTPLMASGDGVLVVAAAPQWAREAVVTLDGRVVSAAPGPAAGDERPTYAVPAGEHELVITVRDRWSWWRDIFGFIAALVVFLAIPFGSRASRRVS